MIATSHGQLCVAYVGSDIPRFASMPGSQLKTVVSAVYSSNMQHLRRDHLPLWAGGRGGGASNLMANPSPARRVPEQTAMGEEGGGGYSLLLCAMTHFLRARPLEGVPWLQRGRCWRWWSVPRAPGTSPAQTAPQPLEAHRPARMQLPLPHSARTSSCSARNGPLADIVVPEGEMHQIRRRGCAWGVERLKRGLQNGCKSGYRRVKKRFAREYLTGTNRLEDCTINIAYCGARVRVSKDPDLRPWGAAVFPPTHSGGANITARWMLCEDICQSSLCS